MNMTTPSLFTPDPTAAFLRVCASVREDAAKAGIDPLDASEQAVLRGHEMIAQRCAEQGVDAHDFTVWLFN